MGQVALERRQDGQSVLCFARDPENFDFQGRKLYPIMLGSQDLLRLAGYLKDKGNRVTSFMLADSYLYRLDPEENREISQRLVYLLDEFGLPEVEASFGDEYRGFYVVGVDVIKKGTGESISIRRRGYFHAASPSAVEELLGQAFDSLGVA